MQDIKNYFSNIFEQFNNTCRDTYDSSGFSKNMQFPYIITRRKSIEESIS